MNTELKSTFNESVEIRERIQNELRQDYKNLKKLVEIVGNEEVEAGDFKFIVDMYHYRHGGYPNPTSKAKHSEVIRKFAEMVRILQFVELDDFLAIDAYGIEVKVTQPIVDFELSSDMLETIKDRGYTGTTFKEFLQEAILRGDYIQSTICNCGDEIKAKAKEIEETAGIKKKHFSSSVMTEYKRRDAANENNEKKMAKIEERIDEEFESYTLSMGLLEKDEEVTK